MIMSSTAKDFFKEFNEQKEHGLQFSGKSAIDALDLVDFQKREFCNKLFDLYKEKSLTEKEMADLTNALSVVEVRAFIKFRTERLTLERLAELYSNAMADKKLISEFRIALIQIVKVHPGLDKIKMNEQIKMNIRKGGSDVLNLDFLVCLIEKLEIVVSSKHDLLPKLR
jgi:hypothetical protein